MEDLTAESANSKQRILKRFRYGALFAAFGFVLLLVAPWMNDDDFIMMPVIFLALGVSFLVSALATYRMSEKMGLLRTEAPSGPGSGAPPDQGATS